MVGAALWTLFLSLAWGRAGYDHNHPEVVWHTLETEHFMIHWPRSGLEESDPHWFTTEFTAGELARIAEESYGPICMQFDHCPEEKVHVVVYDQDSGWEGNGFAIAEMDWTGFAANWGPVYRQRGRMEFLSDVFVHEFAHIVSLKAYLPWSEGTTGFSIGGLVEDEEWLDRWGFQPRTRQNYDIGFEVLFSAHAPFWWAEGGAEYWSHRAGYNFWGTSRDAFLRMSWHENRVLDIDEWTTRIDKAGFDGERGYNQGYAFGLWLHQEYGEALMTRMTEISASRWHGSWEAVVEKATGRTLDYLYQRWRDSLEERFGAQLTTLKERGLVVGRDLSVTEPAWERGDKAWTERSVGKQEEAMDEGGAYHEFPVYSPDGRFLAWHARGLQVQMARPEQWGALGGTYVDEDDSKTLKAWEKRRYTNDWIHAFRVDFSPDSTRLVATGPEDWSSDFAMNQGFDLNTDGVNWPQLLVGTLKVGEKDLDVDWVPVPNTLRAVEAAWHPDGEMLAFSRYADGTHEIWTVRQDGSEGVQRTDFGDGTQVQGIDFSPDGQHILVSLFRNYQQDLWLLEWQTGEWTRLTDSAQDETDPFFGPDGQVWFTSDAQGVYNVFSLDLESERVGKQTELVGGAYGAHVTPEGHLLYTAFTGHGFRIQGLPKSGLAERDVAYPGLCSGGTGNRCEDAQDFVAWRAPASNALGDSRLYRPRDAIQPIVGWPVARLNERSVETGAEFYLGDFTEGHYLEGEATFGKDQYLSLSYWNSMGNFDWLLGAARYAYKGTYGYGTDLDGLAETADDLSVVDIKFEQVSEDVWAYVTTSPSWAIWGGIGADASRYSFRDSGDGAHFMPYVVNSGVGAFLEWTPMDVWYSGDDWINPRGGRRIAVDWQLRHTSLLDSETSGFVYDDGEALDSYIYNRAQITWTEFVPIGWFGATDRHTLQLDLEAGWIDRNVMGWDEFVAGGRHPYHWGSGTIGNNVQFSGYEGWSLTGETMLIANVAYRFPLLRDLNWKVGPVYTDSAYLQVFGTVGNLWSYRVVGDSHIEGYSVVPDGEGSVRREVPFRDYASKNSPGGEEHYWLSDVGVELRVRSFIWNDWDWDSFVRLAYGLQTTAGYGDVNADFVQSSVARDAGTELSAEVEPPTLHVYVGIGTGW